MKRERNSAAQTRASAQAVASLTAMLLMTRDLDRLALDSVARSYRVPKDQIEELLTAEKRRRADHHA